MLWPNGFAVTDGSERPLAVYADTARVAEMRALRLSNAAQGFTTNPTLMRRAGVRSYAVFAAEALEAIGGLPVSFEVLADDEAAMEEQALRICSWGSNAWAKIPVTNTRGDSSAGLVARLLAAGARVNVTAVFNASQVAGVLAAVPRGPRDSLLFSVFAGRIFDTGACAMSVVHESRGVACHHPGTRFLWASVREIYHIELARAAQCDVVTVPPEMIARAAELRGRHWRDFSLETVKQFRRDAVESGMAF